MAKIIIEKAGRKDTIEIKDDVVDKVVNLLLADKKTDYAKKEFKLTKKENQQLARLYLGLNSEDYLDCKARIYCTGMDDKDMEVLLFDEENDGEEDIFKNILTFDLESEVLYSEKVQDYIYNRKELLAKFRAAIKNLEVKYNVTGKDIWNAIVID